MSGARRYCFPKKRAQRSSEIKKALSRTDRRLIQNSGSL
jgi:hypothetical protein